MSTVPATLDLAALGAEFPILAREVHGKPLAYLDNAATKQKPRVVIAAVRDYYERHNANVHRGLHTLANEATELYEGARRTAARFLNAAAPEEVVLTSGVTDSLNLVASSLGGAVLKPGDRVLVTQMEHHSNIVPWQLACERTGATLAVCPVRDDGTLDVDAFRAELARGDVRIATFVHVSNALGTVNPAAELCAMARDAGALTVIDAAQSSAFLPIDVQAIGCDLLGFTGHKVYGPTGIGVLYGRAEILESMPPYRGGGEMIESVSFDGTTFAAPPRRFEAGTPNIAGAAGLGAALEWLMAKDRAALHAHELDLASYGQARLAEVDGLRAIGTAPGKAPVFSFLVDWGHAYDVATLLDHQGVAVRSGHHCTEPLMRRFGVSATLRASCCAYTTREEIDRLVDGLAKARTMLA